CRNTDFLGFPFAILVMQHAVEQGADKEDRLASQTDGMNRRRGAGTGDRPLGLLDLLDRRPGLAVVVGPQQLDEVIALPLLPEAGDPLAQRHQARLLEGVAEADPLAVRVDRPGQDAALALRPALPGHAVVIGVADVDADRAKPADKAVGRPEPAVR